jgi:hypothetical protein
MDAKQTQTVSSTTVAYGGPAIVRRLLNTVPDELLKLLEEIEATEKSAEIAKESK